MPRVAVRDPKASTACHALVDAADWPRVCGKLWRLRKGQAIGNTKHPTRRRWRPGRGHARASATISMARFILGIAIGEPRVVRHVNGNRLDNRRGNLRVVSDDRPRKLAARNAPPRYTPYLGVEWDANAHRWRAQVESISGV